MKKIIGYIFVLMFVVFGFSSVAHASAVVTAGSQTATNGASISVPINVTGFANNVGGIDFPLQYDNTLLTYTGATIGAAFTGHASPTINASVVSGTTSKVALNWFDASTPLTLDSGVLVTLNFTVISAANTTANLNFTGTPLGLTDSIGNTLASSFVNGVITLNPGAASNYTLTAPSPASGTVGVASGNFTVTPNGLYTGTITITPSGAGVGSLTPTVLTFSNSATAQTFTITPNATGSITMTGTNNGGLTNPSTVTYTSNAAASAYTFTEASASGNVGVASGLFTVTPTGGKYTGTITITPSGAGVGSLTPTILTFADSSTAQTFTITPDTAGSITLTGTNNHAITNPSTLTYTANAVVPGAPTGVAAVAGNTTATVTFLAPASNGGVAISGYTVTSIPAGGTDSNAGTTGLSHVMTGLTNGTSYTFTVKATNSVGQSVASAASNAVVPSAPKAITAFNFNALSPAVVGSINQGAFTITLVVPPGTNVTALVPTITITGTSVVPASGVAQDFTNPVTYTVHASDATTQAYTVTVTIYVPPSNPPRYNSGRNPNPSTTTPGCNGTVGFSVVTGQSCVTNTGGVITTYIPTTIPGCNGTVGFSVVTGQSCATNTGGVTTTYTYTPPVTVTINGSTYNFGTVTLKFWSKGEAVKELQRFLNNTLNLNLKVDGILGLKTIAIIRQWQKSHGLVADGLVGAKTKLKMNAESN
jgi:hypothetical protein